MLGFSRDRVVNLKWFVSLKGAHLSGTARFVLGGEWGQRAGSRDTIMKERTSQLGLEG